MSSLEGTKSEGKDTSGMWIKFMGIRMSPALIGRGAEQLRVLVRPPPFRM